MCNNGQAHDVFEFFPVGKVVNVGTNVTKFGASL
jgi:hypothetical protein